MKKRCAGILLAASFALTACQAAAATPQDYVSEDGSFTVTMPEGMEQSELSVAVDSVMMSLAAGDSGLNGSAVVLEYSKTVMKNSQEIESLEDYREYMDDIWFQGQNMSVEWGEGTEFSAEGIQDGYECSGSADMGGTKATAYVRYMETESRYYTALMAGDKKAVEAMKSVFAFEEVPDLALQKSQSATTVDFIYAMTASLDIVNGENSFEAVKALEDGGQDTSDLKVQAVTVLARDWGISDQTELLETASQLMAGMHNQEALGMLDEYGVSPETSRDELVSRMEADGLDEGAKVFLLAAYDARAAFGDNAILAWDLSRIPTIMGFGYAAGYCTYEEAMDQCLAAAQAAQSAFDSWDSFNQSYLYGYSYWTEEDIADAEGSAGQRAALLEDLKADGTFDLDWNMPLEKVW